MKNSHFPVLCFQLSVLASGLLSAVPVTITAFDGLHRKAPLLCSCPLISQRSSSHGSPRPRSPGSHPSPCAVEEGRGRCVRARAWVWVRCSYRRSTIWLPFGVCLLPVPPTCSYHPPPGSSHAVCGSGEGADGPKLIGILPPTTDTY